MRLHPHTIQDKHKFPRSGPDFRKVSIGKWNAHREGSVDAKSNRFGQPRANVMQKTDLTRQPLLALHVFWKSLWLFWLDFVQGSASHTCFPDEKTQRSTFFRAKRITFALGWPERLDLFASTAPPRCALRFPMLILSGESGPRLGNPCASFFCSAGKKPPGFPPEDRSLHGRRPRATEGK